MPADSRYTPEQRQRDEEILGKYRRRKAKLTADRTKVYNAKRRLRYHDQKQALKKSQEKKESESE
jgi:hypothetical protein